METANDIQAVNIFDKGCLVILSISTWSGSVRINKNITTAKMGTEQAKASKYLLPEKALAEVGKVSGECRNWLRSISLPFPIKGACFVPFELIERIDNRLKDLEIAFMEKVNDFCGNYAEYRETVRPSLESAGLFNDDDYPANIKDKFAFSWKFITMSAPGTNTLLNPDFVAREQAKFMDTMEQAQKIGVEALRLEFTTMINNAVDRLTDNSDGKKKIFKNATIDNFTEFFETFKARNCFNDGELSALVEKAESVLQGVNPDTLRKDDMFKAQIATKLTVLQDEVQKGIGSLPGRKLNFD